MFPGFSITNGCVAYFDFVRQSILSYHITDSDSLLTTIADSEIIKLTASVGPSAVGTFDASGKAVYEGKNIKIVAKELKGNDIVHGPDLCVYIENNSKKNITVIVGDLSVNRFTAGKNFFSVMRQQKKAVDFLSVHQSGLDENEITDIVELELNFHIYNSDRWTNVIADTDRVKISIA